MAKYPDGFDDCDEGDVVVIWHRDKCEVIEVLGFSTKNGPKVHGRAVGINGTIGRKLGSARCGTIYLYDRRKPVSVR